MNVLDTDFTLRDEGTIFLITPVTDAARDFAEEGFGPDAPRFGAAYAVEARYVNDILRDLVSHAFTVTLDGHLASRTLH